MSNNKPNQVEGVQAHIDQNGPELAAKVAEFLEASGGAAVAPKEKVVIPPNNDFDIPNPHDTMLTEALVPVDNIVVTDMEKRLFVKALLNNKPVRFLVPLFGGELKVELRSRSLYEQQRIFDVLNMDENDGTIPKQKVDGKSVNDAATLVTRMHKYCMVIMIERVNGELFSELELTPGSPLEHDQKLLHKALEGPVSKVQGIRWTSLMNAMNIFETKCAKMNTEANNEDFWKPREQG